MGFALFLFYNFLSGSFAVPVNALTCVFFCTLFRVANPPQAPKRLRRPGPSPRSAAIDAAAPGPEPDPTTLHPGSDGLPEVPAEPA
jgi:hypothetical protein